MGSDQPQHYLYLDVGEGKAVRLPDFLAELKDPPEIVELRIGSMASVEREGVVVGETTGAVLRGLPGSIAEVARRLTEDGVRCMTSPELII